MDIEWLTYDQFSGRIGERFGLVVGDGPASGLELIEATQGTAAGGRGPEGQERLQFSLVFRGSPALSQGTYRIRHEELGELDLFLVPIGRDGELTKYEAAFA